MNYAKGTNNEYNWEPKKEIKMRIEEIITQNRRDFKARYICENCGDTTEDWGYDDDNFHKNVIPVMVCENCGEKAPKDYVPCRPKYPEGMDI